MTTVEDRRMRSPGRRVRVLKWTFAAASALLIVLWVISLFAAPTVRWQHAAGEVAVVIRQGKVTLATFGCLPWYNADAAVVDRVTEFLKEGVANDYGLQWPYTLDIGGRGSVIVRLTTVPLWLPLISALFAMAVLWWLDRRRVRPGHCGRCGYDLTGNISGVCPECGAAVRGRPADIPQRQARE